MTHGILDIDDGSKTVEFNAREIEFIREQARREYERETEAYKIEVQAPPDEFSTNHLLRSADQISLARLILLKTGRRIAQDALDDDWTCQCGNIAMYDGFHPCNAVGDEVEPDKDWLELVICGRCGIIYTYDGIVYGRRTKSCELCGALHQNIGDACTRCGESVSYEDCIKV